ncbi:MAG: TlpA family protein disulfide reductase [Oligoflexia bacterium]|nr:TlpA family protein disulfide reductase [Oligoflexia bacterium]
MKRKNYKNLFVFLFFALIFTVNCSEVFSVQIDGLKDLNGQNYISNHGKKKELIIFWGTWCKECRQKMGDTLPALDSRKDVAVLTVNMDSDVNRVKNFVDKEGIKLTVLQDTKRALIKDLKVFAVPHWAIYEQEKDGTKWALKDSASAFDINRINAVLNQ